MRKLYIHETLFSYLIVNFVPISIQQLQIWSNVEYTVLLLMGKKAVRFGITHTFDMKS